MEVKTEILEEEIEEEDEKTGLNIYFLPSFSTNKEDLPSRSDHHSIFGLFFQ